MAQRRSTPFAAMLFLGLIGVVFFGAMVWWLSDKPIIKLRPELEKHYGVTGFRCSLRLPEGRLEIEVPSKLPLKDRFAKRRLLAEALHRYLRLTKYRTQVGHVQLLRDGEIVTREQEQQFRDFEPYLHEVVRVATSAGAPPIGKPLHAPGVTGVAVRVDLDADPATAERAASRLLRVPRVTYLEVSVRGERLSESGVDAKLMGRGAIAPVGSPAR